MPSNILRFEPAICCEPKIHLGWPGVVRAALKRVLKHHASTRQELSALSHAESGLDGNDGLTYLEGIQHRLGNPLNLLAAMLRLTTDEPIVRTELAPQR
jgi:hypothetical protein